MDIDQEVSDKVGSSKIDGNDQPVVGKRQTTSYVTVKSGEIIVLGGMQRKNDSTSTSRLGPIPFIGDLLGSRSKSAERTDIIFFLRPVILTNTSDDNKEYLKRLELNPHKADVQRALDPSIPEPAKKETKGPSVRGKQ
jgi:general secretion pathway protein D